jgi:hypothetical protein
MTVRGATTSKIGTGHIRQLFGKTVSILTRPLRQLRSAIPEHQEEPVPSRRQAASTRQEELQQPARSAQSAKPGPQNSARPSKSNASTASRSHQCYAPQSWQLSAAPHRRFRAREPPGKPRRRDASLRLRAARVRRASSSPVRQSAITWKRPAGPAIYRFDPGPRRSRRR